MKPQMRTILSTLTILIFLSLSLTGSVSAASEANTGSMSVTNYESSDDITIIVFFGEIIDEYPAQVKVDWVVHEDREGSQPYEVVFMLVDQTEMRATATGVTVSEPNDNETFPFHREGTLVINYPAHPLQVVHFYHLQVSVAYYDVGGGAGPEWDQAHDHTTVEFV